MMMVDDPNPQPPLATLCNPLDHYLHAVEGRYPIRHEVAQVVCAEESLHAFKQSVIVLIPHPRPLPVVNRCSVLELAEIVASMT
jgi:hypothetical protein